MTHEILYSELQPCVLLSCKCKPDEPFLMMFRSMTQVIECGNCKTAYGIVYEGAQARAIALPQEKPRKAAAN